MKKFLLPLILLGNFAFAQVTDQGTILSKTIAQNTAVQHVILPEIDIERYKSEDEINDLNPIKPFRFGAELDTNYTAQNSGTWVTLPNGDRIWRLTLESKNALTLNFLFNDYQLSPNAKLYMHNEEGQFLGYYTANENNKTQQVISWPIDGSRITVEFYEPATEIGQSTFEISKVVHGYRTVRTMDNGTKGLNTSGHCNVDVGCEAGNPWEMQKQAVALVLNGTQEWCTGTLVNNTAQDGTPYFLTANHCRNNNTPNWSFRFKWISENPDCATTAPSGDGPRIYSMSGAEIVSRNTGTDFMLLRLNNEIPVDWNLTFVGWDRTGTVPENVTGLHHPDGDIMKIAQYFTAPLQTSRYSISGWEIPAWDLGVTEGGSSGSGLFDHNGRIIGQLYGGEAACSGLVDNGKHDNYGRFDVSWEGGGTPATRLKDWLDPTNSGVMTTDHYVKELLATDLSVTAVNINENCETSVTPVVVIKNTGTSTINQFVVKYKYNDGQETSLTINETLATNQTFNLTLPEQELNAGDHTIQVQAILSGDLNPNNNSRTTSFNILESFNSNKVILTLTTDNYARETTWSLKNSSGQVIARNATLQNATTYTTEFDNLANDCYTFEILDSASDGICCGYGQGSYSLTLPDGTILKQGGNFTNAESTLFKLDYVLNTSDINAKEIAIYPNPTNDAITLSVPEKFGKYTYEVYSTLGQMLKSGQGNGEQKVNLKAFGKGTFVIKIKTDKGISISKKVIVK